MRKILIVTLIIFINALYGFSIAIKPGWNYARVPSEAIYGSGISENIGSVHIGLQIGFNISPVFGVHFRSIYNPRNYHYEIRNEDGIYIGALDIGTSNLYLNYEHRFTIPIKNVVPYFILGAALKIGFYDIGVVDKNTWNIVAGHGYKIRLNSHLSLTPEALVYYQLTSPSKFYAVMISLGLCYDL